MEAVHHCFVQKVCLLKVVATGGFCGFNGDQRKKRPTQKTNSHVSNQKVTVEEEEKAGNAKQKGSKADQAADRLLLCFPLVEFTLRGSEREHLACWPLFFS